MNKINWLKDIDLLFPTGTKGTRKASSTSVVMDEVTPFEPESYEPGRARGCPPSSPVVQFYRADASMLLLAGLAAALPV